MEEEELRDRVRVVELLLLLLGATDVSVEMLELWREAAVPDVCSVVVLVTVWPVGTPVEFDMGNGG